MTVKLVVLYTTPDDADAFEAHYLAQHVPLVHAIPGLARFESGMLTAPVDGGEHTYHRIAELYFPDQAALQTALGTDEGKATAADFGKIAAPGSRMFVATVDE